MQKEAELLSASEAAAVFDVTSQSIRRWVDEGRLEALRIGKGRLVFYAEEVERFKRERAKS
jgi:excisionase family DNA binding protein